jgi:proline dehydrogenase
MQNNLFDNIDIAFRYKSYKDLKKTRFIFKYFFKNWLIAIARIKLNILLKLKLNFLVKIFVKPTVYKIFCGGENLEEAIKTAQHLNNYNVKSILDYAAEEAKSLKNAEQTFQEILKLIDTVKNYEFIPFTVFKPSGLCPSSILEKKSAGIKLSEDEKIYYEKFLFYVNELCKKSYENNIPILIDAEYVSTQEIVDSVILEMMLKYNKNKAIVYNTLQMYRKDRLQYLKNMHQKAIRDNFYLGIKIVRGAYLEQERKIAKRNNTISPVFDTKEETDNSYNEALAYCLKHIDRIALFSGTHNEQSNYLMINLMKEYNIPKNDKRVFSSQLYGMSDHISFNLANEGYNVAKYIPFGKVKITIPYLLRRADENKSIGSQVSRELKLIEQAIKDRKN